MEITIDELRELCNNKAIRWTAHVMRRLIQRGISRSDVIEAIQRGEIIEQYQDDYPFPSCLVLGFTIAGKALHVVCGIGEAEIWIITAYCPNPAEWEDDLKIRKQV